MGLLNFPIRCIFYFIVEKNYLAFIQVRAWGSFLTPGLKTCTFLAIERKQGFQRYCLGALGLGFLFIVAYQCIRGFV